MQRVVVVFLWCCALLSGASNAQSTSRYDVLAEYVRELGAIESMRSRAADDQALSNDPANAVRNLTRIKLVLRTNIQVLSAMKLEPPFGNLIPSIVNIYRQKLELNDALIDIASQLIDASQSKVELGKLQSDAAKIVANLDFLNDTQFDVVPLLCMLLYDDKKLDSKGQYIRLVVTNVQRKALIYQIESSFGSKLDATNRNHTVAAATILRACLSRDLKSADDP